MLKAIWNLPRNLTGYIRDVAGELKLVDWISFKNVIRGAFTVILITFMMLGFLAATDGVLVAIRTFAINLI